MRFPVASCYLRNLLVPVLAVVLTACAARVVPATENVEVQLRVENNVVPPDSVTVFLVPERGERRTLGTVSPSDTLTFEIDPATVTGRFRLLAVSTAGTETLSDAVNVAGNSSLAWNLRANLLVVAAGEPLQPRPLR